MQTGADVVTAVRALLAAAGAPYEVVEHAEVRTAGEAAAVRGMALEQGAKSILLKIDDRFGLFVMSAARAIASRHVRRHLGISRSRFATAAELARLTGVEPGGLPPFGRPIFDLPLYADPSVLEPTLIAFTAGVRDRSILMSSADWQTVAVPEIFTFTREETP